MPNRAAGVYRLGQGVVNDPVCVSVYRRGDLGAIAGIHQNSTARFGAKINAYCIHMIILSTNMKVRRSLLVVYQLIIAIDSVARVNRMVLLGVVGEGVAHHERAHRPFRYYDMKPGYFHLVINFPWINLQPR